MLKTKVRKNVVRLNCFVIPILLLIILIDSVISGLTYSEADVIKKNTGVDVSACKIVRLTNDHGGFLGDGVTFAEADCSGHEADIISGINSAKGWKNLPASENSEVIIETLEENYNIESSENGYYYFYDRHSEAENPYSDEEVFSRYSYNYTFAVYYTENARLYLYILDT